MACQVIRKAHSISICMPSRYENGSSNKATGCNTVQLESLQWLIIIECVFSGIMISRHQTALISLLHMSLKLSSYFHSIISLRFVHSNGVLKHLLKLQTLFSRQNISHQTDHPIRQAYNGDTTV